MLFTQIQVLKERELVIQRSFYGNQTSRTHYKILGDNKVHILAKHVQFIHLRWDTYENIPDLEIAKPISKGKMMFSIGIN